MKIVIAAINAAVVLAACGGGGGDSAPIPMPAPTPTLQEGLYMAASVFNFWDLTGQPVSILVLENQDVWGLESQNPPLFFGQGTFEFTGSVTATNGPTSYSFSQSKALVALRSNVLGEIPLTLTQTGGLTLSLPSLPNEASRSAQYTTPEKGFDYNKPASIQAISGTWGTGTGRSSFVDVTEPKNKALTVDSSGAISAPAQSSGCSLAGTLTPRPSGKNVFNLSLTLTGCPDAGVYSGIAFSYMDAADYVGSGPYVVPTIRLIATNSDKTRVFSMTTSR